MRVQVDKAGRDNAARGIQNAIGGLPFQASDLGDFAALDRRVADVAWRTGVPSTIVPPLMIMS